MKYKHQQAIDEFRKKFVKNVTKQVDTSNSIVLPMWKDNYTHLSRDIEQFLDEQLSKKEEEVRASIEKDIPVSRVIGMLNNLVGADLELVINDAVRLMRMRTYQEAINMIRMASDPKTLEQLKTQTKK